MDTPALTSLHAQFVGPFGWIERDGVPSIFDAPEGRVGGLYLWTVAVSDGELVYYVGETSRSFAQRHREHLKEHLAGTYHVYDPTAFRQGKKIELWSGQYDPRSRPTVGEWLARYPSLTAAISELVGVYRFFVAPAPWETRLRHRAEAAIARALWDSGRNFQDEGVRYRPRQKDESALSLTITCSHPLLGLPSTLSA